MQKKYISILGSTGSIGKSTLKLVESNPDRFKVVGLAANKSVEALKEQIIAFAPEIVATTDRHSAEVLLKWAVDRGLSNGKTGKLRVTGGEEGLVEVASHESADFVISAIVGASGLKPTLAAIRAGKRVGLANKETLVMAGALVMAEARAAQVAILPVDSEHSAIFQCMEGRKSQDVQRLILTASGGPFFGKTHAELENVTSRDALKHPNWSMGSKISIDSATLMNKGLEVIEAYHLFGFSVDCIDVVVHPESIVHSMVEFVDGALLAQLSVPDMKGPIAYALSYPERIPKILKRCSLENIGRLTFHRPDNETFPCLKYAYYAIGEGGTMPAVLNAANEALVNLFLRGIVKFNEIPVIIEKVMRRHKTGSSDDLEEIFIADMWAREMVKQEIDRNKSRGTGTKGADTAGAGSAGIDPGETEPGGVD
ncbi:MAG: 1-deoxy-D-xylulose-5-phosphate reductoisomerase [Nitrospirae bacterium]|nr:1-deoxy-D-xylulose-5-phosphate reductoisomerase [Nitrospirota bacterium]